MGREGERKGEQRNRVFWEPLSLNENYQLPNVRTKVQIGRNERNVVEKKPTTSPITPPFNSFLPPPPQPLSDFRLSIDLCYSSTVCLSVCLFFLSLSLRLSFCLSISICHSVFRPVLFVSVCLCIFLRLSICLSITKSVYPFVCLSFLSLSPAEANEGDVQL